MCQGDISLTLFHTHTHVRAHTHTHTIYKNDNPHISFANLHRTTILKYNNIPPSLPILVVLSKDPYLPYQYNTMAGGGFATAPIGPRASQYESKITFYVIITCIIASSGGLMFGYDVGISGITITNTLCSYLTGKRLWSGP